MLTILAGFVIGFQIFAVVVSAFMVGKEKTGTYNMPAFIVGAFISGVTILVVWTLLSAYRGHM
jgi:uncharacterized membrane protein